MAIAQMEKISMPATERSKETRARRPAQIVAYANKYFNSNAAKRIGIVRERVEARFVVKLVAVMGISKTRFYEMTGLPRATIDRKIRGKILLSQGESENVLGLVQLVGQAQRIVAQSGVVAGFDAAAWVAEWLAQPHAALGGTTPGELMDTAEGRTLVGNLLSRQQTSAFS
jgi:uncharacterized protein (DUF2384 family)